MRASRAEELGLVSMLSAERGEVAPAALIAAIRRLPTQRLPSEAGAGSLMGGLTDIKHRVRKMFADRYVHQPAAM